jgi:hypothetical protein
VTTETTAAGSTNDAPGPIDFVLLEFSSDRLTGEAGPALLDLVERGVIRLLDLQVVRKAEDGSVDVLELTDPLAESGGFTYFAGASSGILGDDDVRQAAEAISPGMVAALIVYENTWAAPFVAAVRNSGWGTGRQRTDPCHRHHRGAGRPRAGRLTRAEGLRRTTCQDSFAGLPARQSSSRIPEHP